MSPFDSGAADAAAEGLLADDRDDMLGDAPVRIPARSVPSFHGNVEGATAYVGDLVTAGWSVVVTASGAGLVERARDVLAEREIAAALVEDADAAPEPGRATLAVAQLERGFELEDARLSLSSTDARSVATAVWSRSSRRSAGTSSIHSS